VPEADSSRGVAIPADVFKEMVAHVDFAAAKEDNRPVLTGILTRFDGDTVTMAAADGYRLAVRTALIDTPVSDTYQIIIPSRTLTEVSRIIGDSDDDVLI